MLHRGSLFSTGLLALVLSSACVPKQGPHVKATPAAAKKEEVTPPGHQPKQEELMQDSTPLLTEVSRLRGLAQKRITPVLFQDDSAFEQSLVNSSRRESVNDTAFDNFHFWLALSTLSPNDIGERERFGDSGIAGFYDRSAQAILMKRSASLDKEKDGSVSDHTAWILAHEATHALQAQHFGLADWKKYPEEDERLAIRALYEGDAMVTMLGYQMQRNFGSLRRAIINREREVNAEAERDYRLATGSGSDFDKRNLLARARMFAPYTDGLRFAAALYRTAGFGLLNAAYQRPPRSSEQVLHIHKYLAGEMPHRLPAPPSPENYSSIADGRVGELLLRATLDQCTAKSHAVRAAAGWGGDRMVLSRRRGRHALAWSTSWDTVKDAKEFEETALGLVKCWRRRDREAKEDAMFSGQSVVDRQEDRVVVLHGYPDEAAIEAGLSATFSQQVKRPVAQVPVKGISYTPLTPAPIIRPPYIAQGKYVNEEWNLKIPIPPKATTTTEDDVLLVEGPDKSYVVHVHLSDWFVTRESNKKILEGFGESLKSNGSEDEEIRTPLGAGHRRNWFTYRGADGVATLVLVPLCGGKGSWVFAAKWDSFESGQTVRTMIEGITKYKPSGLPACHRLDPK